MTTTVPDDPDVLGTPRRTSNLRATLSSMREAFDRPLTSYYMLVGASALLLTIGLVMVLSASSVWSFKVYDGDSYAVVRRQLMWLSLGLPAAFIASRMPLRWVRALAYPAYLFSLVLLLATAFVGTTVNGNQNWLGVGSLAIQPSEVAKLALVLWAAHIYANKERRLHSLHQLVVPVVPGLLLATLLVVAGRDLGTALIFFAILLGMLWVVGAPARLFWLAISLVSVAAIGLAATDTERVARITNFADPSRTTSTPAGSPPAASTRCPRAAGSGRASAPASRSGATCPRRTPTTSSPCSARSSGWSAPSWSSSSS